MKQKILLTLFSAAIITSTEAQKSRIVLLPMPLRVLKKVAGAEMK